MTPPRLSVTSDLHVEIDGTAATVRADGGVIRVDIEDPATALRALAGSYGGRAGVRRAAATLASLGLTAEVHGPHGRLTTAGAGVRSRLGGLITGSRQVAAGPGAVASVASMVPGRAYTALAALVLVVVVRRRT